MRDSLSRLVEEGRIRGGPQASSPEDGPNGAFLIRVPETGVVLRVRASNGARWLESGLPDPVWEHVRRLCRARRSDAVWRARCGMRYPLSAGCVEKARGGICRDSEAGWPAAAELLPRQTCQRQDGPL